MNVNPKEPIHPDEVLKENLIAKASLTVARAAEILGVGRPSSQRSA